LESRGSRFDGCFAIRLGADVAPAGVVAGSPGRADIGGGAGGAPAGESVRGAGRGGARARLVHVARSRPRAAHGGTGTHDIRGTHPASVASFDLVARSRTLSADGVGEPRRAIPCTTHGGVGSVAWLSGIDDAVAAERRTTSESPQRRPRARLPGVEEQ